MVNVRVHVFVSGRVQGVFFRQSTQLKALGLGIKGWVRNLPDGRVEAVFEGDQTDVKKIVEYCHSGPPNAKVEKVEVHVENYASEFTSFEAL